MDEPSPFAALKEYRKNVSSRLDQKKASGAKEPPVLKAAPNKKASEAKKRSVEQAASGEGISEQRPTGQEGNPEAILLEPVTPSLPLPTGFKRILDEEIASARKELGKDDFDYIDSHFEGKVESVLCSRTSWVRALAEQMQLLHQLYQAHASGESALDEDVLTLIGVTLHYFVNPYDIIPDHKPGQGYLDDAYVYNKCAKELIKKKVPLRCSSPD